MRKANALCLFFVFVFGLSVTEIVFSQEARKLDSSEWCPQCADWQMADDWLRDYCYYSYNTYDYEVVDWIDCYCQPGFEKKCRCWWWGVCWLLNGPLEVYWWNDSDCYSCNE